MHAAAPSHLHRLRGLFRLRWWLPPLALALVVVAHDEWMPVLGPRVPLLAGLGGDIRQLAPLALRSLYVLVPLALLAVLWPGRTPARRRRRSVVRASPEEVQERLAETLRSQGCAVHARCLDGDGADLLVVRNGERMLVQCRHWRRRQIETEPLRALCGLVSREKASGALFLTRGRLSVEAIRFMRDVPIVLVDESGLEELLAAGPDALRRVDAALGQRGLASNAA